MDLTTRTRQDELLQIRNDLMTVYREVGAGDRRLFPLRYARATPPDLGLGRPRIRARRDGQPRRYGDGSSPAASTVLVIPDGPGDASVIPYDFLRRQLAAKDLDVIMVEHRGVGLSRLDAEGNDLPPHAMRIGEVLADLEAVLDHALVERATVYGCGYGAYLGLLFAALHPERVTSLVLDSPMLGAEDELLSQRQLRARYWEGTDPSTDTIAATLRRLDAQGVIDAHTAGPVVHAVHEYGGTQDVRDLVDLLARGRGELTWTSVWQVLTQEWVQSTRYLQEPDLVSWIAHTGLGSGVHADGGPMDALLLAGRRARGLPAFTGEEFDARALAPSVQAPTLVLSGRRDLVTVPAIARGAMELIPAARLLEVPETGHGILDTHSQLAQIAIRWSAAGVGLQLVDHGTELAKLPSTPASRALAQGLRLALAAERVSPWRLRLEVARTRRAVDRGRRG